VKTSNIFQQWKLSGGRDWRPLLRGLLGQNVIAKHEILSRNAFMRGPVAHWTYGGNATDFNSLGSDDKFGLDIVNAWNLRLGQTGLPVIPGDMASAKLALIPPGCIYDFFAALASASTNEASMWRDSKLYAGEALRYELGAHKNVRFVQVPTDRYGFNPSVLYNAGAIVKQYAVTTPINAGDGSPDPETTAVDDVWYVGQKDVTHYLQLENFSAGDYNAGDIVTIHTARTSTYGVTNGVNPLAGNNVNRRVVSVDADNNRICLDRPVMNNFKTAFAGKSVTGNADGVFYAYVTRAKHVGFVLVLGARGGVLGGVAKPLEFYEPRPVDDFESVWRYVWDSYMGFNVWEPDLFECHFVSVTLPKAGGLISP
jgi:hypothetical protein